MIYDEKCEAGIRLASFFRPLPSCACVSTFGSLLRQENGEVGESGRTRQTLWRAVQMLTQKLCCQTIHDCPKVVPLHYESE